MSMLSSALRNLFRRPFTTRYPYASSNIPETNRGRVMWDMRKCIFCRKCERNCPTRAILTDKVSKTQSVFRHRCITCNTCVEVCPTQTISMHPEYSKPDLAPVVHVFDVELPPFEYRVEHATRTEELQKPSAAPPDKE